MTNVLQQFLRGNPADGVERLERQYGITCRRGVEFPNLCLFKYSQINSPMSEPVVQASRGVILDETDNWTVVCHSFDKFFNYGEPLAAQLNWDRAVVQEKLDGSLIQMYFYRGQWRIASSGNPEGAGDVNGHNITFAQLFWKTFAAQGLSIEDFNHDADGDRTSVLNRTWERFTFAWELTSPMNRVVVAHREPRVTLIGMRDTRRNIEYGIFQAPALWPKVKHYGFLSRDTILSMMETLDPLQQEGFVVVDDRWNRVKMKSAQYVAIHHARGNGGMPTAKRALEMILTGESAEILANFPEWQPIFDEIDGAYRFVCEEIARALATYTTLCVDPTNRKEFASYASTSRYSAALFAMKFGGVKTADAYLRSIRFNALVDLLCIKPDPQASTEDA